MGMFSMAMPFIQGIAGLFGAAENTRQTEEDRKLAQQRYNDAMAEGQGIMGLIGQPYSPATYSQPTAGQQALGIGPEMTSAGHGATGLYSLADQLGGRYQSLTDTIGAQGNALAAGIPGQYRDFATQQGNALNDLAASTTGRYLSDLGSLNDAYQRRTDTAMGMLEGFGRQQLSDVRQNYANAGNAQQAGLIASGLGGTSLAGNAAQGNTRLMQADLRRTNEDIQGMKLNTYGQMSGQQLAARQAGIDSWNQLNAQMGTHAQDVQTQLGQQALDVGRDMSQWNLGLQNALGTANLSAQQSLALMPIQAQTDMTKFIMGGQLGYQGAPDAVPLGTGFAAALQPVNDYFAQQAANRAMTNAAVAQGKYSMGGGLMSMGGQLGGAAIKAWG